VRRIEALTGPAAFRWFVERERQLDETARVLRTPTEHVVRRAEQVLEEQGRLEQLIDDLRAQGGAGETVVGEAMVEPEGAEAFRFRAVRITARDADDARSWGDRFISEGSGVALLAADLPEDRHSLFAFVTDDLIPRGIRADVLVREVAEVTGGRGGGRPHLAQAGVGDAARLDEALGAGEAIVRRLVEGA
jgi:alanyl-tRNA synthetase